MLVSIPAAASLSEPLLPRYSYRQYTALWRRSASCRQDLVFSAQYTMKLRRCHHLVVLVQVVSEEGLSDLVLSCKSTRPLLASWIRNGFP